MQHASGVRDVPQVPGLVSGTARTGAQTRDFKPTSLLWPQGGKGLESVQDLHTDIKVYSIEPH